MSNAQKAALAVAAVLVAVGLYLVLSDDAPPPRDAERVTAAEPMPDRGQHPAPPVVPVQPVPPAVVAAVEGRTLDASAPEPVAVVAVAVADAGGLTEPPAEVAASPFESSDSPEVQYAVKLVLEGKTATEWTKAVEVLQRCVDQNPTNHLCKRALRGAWERLDSDGGEATSLRRGAMTVDPKAITEEQLRLRPVHAPPGPSQVP